MFPMSPTRPYQPLLLRLLHGAMALLTLLAIASGFWVYNTYDGRWGSLPLPKPYYTQDLHGTGALALFLFMFPFAIYCFHLGDRRLWSDQSWEQLRKPGTPGFWLALQRLANTLMLVALTMAVVTGRMMQESWLPQKQLNHLPYLFHLLAWLVVVLCLGFHLLFSAKVGGIPLWRSMVSWGRRAKDNPQQWLRDFRWQLSAKSLQWLQWLVLAGLLFALTVPLFA
ncbi:cytochrome b/b6 domain-containing protein [Synechocystis salina LEGE 00031]|uniref:Cytochrome b/b6 domain-containing protein n=2 Tax=Synechocystis TaxID=1142 RepID=A0ABR9VQN2_9SYNC|nr:cytochrome b/b6 domain-containing protein [Synechocystis salina LEGE 00041]MBE9253663.1 cytochrome b/b6 domain-containing protein [Synechocystis salina LEGE 00031]